jgi:hypothetical protein
MSRGLGKIQKSFYLLIRNAGTPVTFNELCDILRAASDLEPGFKILPSRIRSWRRAIHSLVKTGDLIQIGHHPSRYFPADAKFAGTLTGNLDAAKATIIATLNRITSGAPPDADVKKIIHGVLMACVAEAKDGGAA